MNGLSKLKVKLMRLLKISKRIIKRKLIISIWRSKNNWDNSVLWDKNKHKNNVSLKDKDNKLELDN